MPHLEHPASMKLRIGLALNEALCENLFVLLVSVLNSIPVFVVGKPGSSKSLAVSILRANLNGRASATAFLRTFPAVEVFFHQCSPQSTSQGILQASSLGCYAYTAILTWVLINVWALLGALDGVHHEIDRVCAQTRSATLIHLVHGALSSKVVLRPSSVWTGI